MRVFIIITACVAIYLLYSIACDIARMANREKEDEV